KGNAVDETLVPAQRTVPLGPASVPKANGAIGNRGGHDRTAVRCVTHGSKRTRVAVQHTERSAGRCVPQARRLIEGSRDQIFPVGAERDFPDMAAVALPARQGLARPPVPEADGLVQTAGSNAGTVRAERE